jgi:hypothetical protein
MLSENPASQLKGASDPKILFKFDVNDQLAKKDRPTGESSVHNKRPPGRSSFDPNVMRFRSVNMKAGGALLGIKPQ